MRIYKYVIIYAPGVLFMILNSEYLNGAGGNLEF